ncbi:hypothetical protein L873DRAFT_1121943 [Choiromyces venosus 120613-1]|uniref:Uncharacterized protein n=1 Tax=Choiromyces venosus 120613-1 TaxID=1336337 RepID=A0A3N4JGS9_9PEZI|nr:hypothetical protein L873DRAFT_1121943 [Choiromyces venosus 120613-1]
MSASLTTNIILLATLTSRKLPTTPFCMHLCNSKSLFYWSFFHFLLVSFIIVVFFP